MSKLTTAERNALPSSDFADPKDRKFPIEDANHRKAAFGRIAQHTSGKRKVNLDNKVKSFGRGGGKGPFSAS